MWLCCVLPAFADTTQNPPCLFDIRFEMLTRPETRVRRKIGGNERLDDDTECPKRQPKHRESENNNQEWMERSALPTSLFRGSIAALGEKLCNPVIPERHLRNCLRMRNQSLDCIHFRRQVWPARLSLETNGSWKPFVISVSTKMDARL